MVRGRRAGEKEGGSVVDVVDVGGGGGVVVEA